ncbi:MAG: branched-chain amino acid ABC transporter permease [Synergistaceae bacterium]|jgi:branched-chain amino acid transport system permease protein|nr:branched-chain amino acid ABC transporter permease [Synergistaceae bacterium]PKL04464.1 MAG: branched-chain amino acid ABC transporter permease [Synergistetes bacterium HGW-Synergistetes-1]MBP9559805.1 branched-chain amino acid ABC transporter permease [Synergistaceae bacterium]MBP9975041.1 branched-chain amino acid ABC transporter permease [Synergistaceae bacterium]MCE5184174.1 branched-chain amino acid ABC transporter permease [Synergistaceae bacterium]
MMEKKTKIILNLLLTLLLALFLWWANGNLDGYKIQVLNLIAVNAILALSLNLIYGFTGMFSLGHAGFMAIGAYVSAILILPAAQKEMMYILEPIIWPFSVLEAPFFISVLAGGLIAALLGLLIALPVLRLGGDYLGIATLGFAEIIRVVFTNITPVTNGALGLKGIPPYANLGWNYFWCVLTFFVIVKLLSSNFGNCLRAIRDDEVAAKAMGINTFKCRAISFAVGAFFAGVGGALMGSLITTIDPKMFNFQLTFNILMIVVAGGLGSITGSMVGAVVITVLLEWLRFVEDTIEIGSFVLVGIPGMRMVIFSLVLLLIILYRREGIIGGYEFSWDSVTRRFSSKKEDE